MQQSSLYWLAQITGWLAYTVLAGIVNQLDGNAFNAALVINLTAVWLLGIVVSHGFKLVIVSFGLLSQSILKLIAKGIPLVLLCGLVFHSLHTAVVVFSTFQEANMLNLSFHVQRILGWSSLFFIWGILYFTYHYFRNFKLQEIKNLRIETARVESELNNLKSQLNPHFMFNAMNSIRALVDENPQLAKQSITQLSNILRSSLMAGKKEKIPLAEEIKIVKDYLALEKTRYEERLTVNYAIAKETENFKIPPMLLQTLAENAIKHGLSKLPDGGTLQLRSFLENGSLILEVVNSGKFETEKSRDTGIGILNTKKRLQLIYGNLATFSIKNLNNTVNAKVVIPIKKDQHD